MTEPDYEPTRLIRKSSSPKGGNPSQEGDLDENTTRIMRETDDDTTRLVHQGDSSGSPADAEVTKLVRPSSASRRGDSSGEAQEEDSSGPVVGWLVVVNGPGKGRSRELGYGMNAIGRGDKNRVQLDFGDQEISRDKHAMLTYDPRGGQFFLQHGESTNLTYLEDSPVLSPTEISNGQTIRIGDTTVVKFVALCGPDFHWED